MAVVPETTSILKPSSKNARKQLKLLENVQSKQSSPNDNSSRSAARKDGMVAGGVPQKSTYATDTDQNVLPPTPIQIQMRATTAGPTEKSKSTDNKNLERMIGETQN
jgi:hypothetical protein